MPNPSTFQNNLESALYFAEQYGCKLFPSYWKNTHHPLIAWGTDFSSNPSTIRQWAKKYPNCYFCVNLKESNLCVIDLDNKPSNNGKPGKDGILEWSTLEDFEFKPIDKEQIIRVITPSGGHHYYMLGHPGFQGVNLFGRNGIDIPGMVPLPGQTVPGKGKYKLQHLPSKLLTTPQWIIDNAKPGRIEKAENAEEWLVEPDQPQNILRCISHIMQMPVSEEGNHDVTAFDMAHLCRDYGLSEQLCIDVMLNVWNVRCNNVWSDTELAQKVRNAYKSFSLPAGNKTYEVEFPDDTLPPIPPGSKEDINRKFRFIQSSDVWHDMKSPEWLVRKYIEANTTGMWYGAYSSFKSFLAIDMGHCISTNRPWAGQGVKPGPVFYLAGEGHGTIQRRVRAWLMAHAQDENPPVPARNSNFFFSSYTMTLDTEQNMMLLIEIIRGMQKEFGHPVLIIIDTLAKHFGNGDENSTKDMGRFISLVDRYLREELGSTVLIVHHTGHDKSRARGSYALPAGIDFNYPVEKEEGLCCLKKPPKMKDAEPPPDTWFQMRKWKVGTEVVKDPITGKELLEDVFSLVPEHLPDYDRTKLPTLSINETLIKQIIDDMIEAEPSEDWFKSVLVRREFKRLKEEKGEEYKADTYSKALSRLVDKGIAETKKDDSRVLVRIVQVEVGKEPGVKNGDNTKSGVKEVIRGSSKPGAGDQGVKRSQEDVKRILEGDNG